MRIFYRTQSGKRGLLRKIGVITWHYHGNFGSALQTYALQRILEKLGNKVEIINYRESGEYSKKKDLLRLFAHYLFKLFGNNRFAYSFLRFQIQYLNQSAPIQSLTYLNNNASQYDCIICGSDQIWAPNVFNSVYMLDFADGSKVKKISYAASIGLNGIPNNLIPLYKELLSDFGHISVREQTGQKILKDKCGINSTVVLDPTFLLGTNEYRDLQKKPGILDKFIFCYFLSVNHGYQKVVQEYAKKNGYRIVGWSAKASDCNWMTLMQWIGPCEFLWLIEQAECVITDSYHATIFSLLFHKKFWTFERFSADDPICQNSRIYQLDDYFEIGERIIRSDSSLCDCTSINYENFEDKLKELKDKSINYIKEALE